MRENYHDRRGWNRREALKRQREVYRAKREAELVKQRFLSTISHDMRTPLNAILGMTRMAAANLEDPDRVRQCLDKMECSEELLAGLVNNILELSRMEKGNLTLKYENASIKKFMNSLDDMMGPEAAAMNQEMTVSCKDLHHDIAEFDPLRLNQVMTNLISNAIKFTPRGGKIQVEVTEEAISGADRARFRFVVSDTGIGMSEECIKKLFCAFERECDGRLEACGSVGIGMAMVEKLVKLMDGKIEVQSVPGKGTSVTVILEFRVTEVEKQDLKLNFCGKHFLLIEDNELNLEIAREFLLEMGAEVDTARNGAEGVACFLKSAEFYYDLILTDIHMPVMDGYEAARTIRSLKTRGRKDAAAVPVIAMTSDGYDEDIAASKRAGMTGHLVKPLNFAVMQQEIGTALSKKVRISI